MKFLHCFLLVNSCGAHTLQLIIKSSLTEAEALINSCQLIASHFSRSPRLLQQLKEEQKLHSIEPQLKIILSVETRWNSTFYMLERLSKLRNDVERVLHNNGNEEYCLNKDEWFHVAELVRLLAEFEEATRMISSDKYPTLSIFAFIVRGLTKYLEDFSSKSSIAMQVCLLYYFLRLN
jgi:hypothetical protein